MRSLRLRLIGFASLALAAALLIAWFVIGASFEHFTERRMVSALSREGETMASLVRLDARGRPQLALTDMSPRSRVIGSGLYWEIQAPGGTLRSPSLGDKRLALVHPGHHDWGQDEIPGPFEQDMIATARNVDTASGPIQIRIAEDDEPIDRAQQAFSHEMAIFLSCLGVALALAAWLQVELGLRPLKRVRADLSKLRRNPSGRLPDGYPSEIAGLATAINDLAEAREEDLARARRRAADLAHALKTPLSALAAQSRRARDAGAGEAADAIDQTLSAAGAVLEGELARARAAASRIASETAMAAPAAIIDGLVAVLERTEAGMLLAFEVDVPANWRLAIDPEAFTEIIGNLLDNATRYAHRIIVVRGSVDAKAVTFSIHDDGPGIPVEVQGRVMTRGVRLDERGSGHGLGLSIVKDLTEATDGRFVLSNAVDGGLSAMLAWPIARLDTGSD